MKYLLPILTLMVSTQAFATNPTAQDLARQSVYKFLKNTAKSIDIKKTANNDLNLTVLRVEALSLIMLHGPDDLKRALPIVNSTVDDFSGQTIFEIRVLSSAKGLLFSSTCQDNGSEGIACRVTAVTFPS